MEKTGLKLQVGKLSQIIPTVRSQGILIPFEN